MVSVKYVLSFLNSLLVFCYLSFCHLTNSTISFNVKKNPILCLTIIPPSLFFFLSFCVCVYVCVRRLLDIPQGDSCYVRGPHVARVCSHHHHLPPLSHSGPAPLLHGARVNVLRSHFASRLSPMPLMSYLLNFIFTTETFYIRVCIIFHRHRVLLFWLNAE